MSPSKAPTMNRRAKIQRKGHIVVEMSLILPLLLSLLFGMMEYGRFVMLQNLLTNASREGARVAAMSVGSTNTSINTAYIQNIVTQKMAGFSITNQTVNVYKYNTSNPSDMSQNWQTAIAFQDQVAVSITGNYGPMLPFYQINPLVITLPRAIPVQVTAIMMCESS